MGSGDGSSGSSDGSCWLGCVESCESSSEAELGALEPEAVYSCELGYGCLACSGCVEYYVVVSTYAAIAGLFGDS